ncbi:MAG: hypothetical protein ACYCW6_16550 [Candidatus Xenobia bacterium]
MMRGAAEGGLLPLFSYPIGPTLIGERLVELLGPDAIAKVVTAYNDLVAAFGEAWIEQESSQTNFGVLGKHPMVAFFNTGSEQAVMRALELAVDQLRRHPEGAVSMLFLNMPPEHFFSLNHGRIKGRLSGDLFGRAPGLAAVQLTYESWQLPGRYMYGGNLLNNPAVARPFPLELWKRLRQVEETLWLARLL